MRTTVLPEYYRPILSLEEEAALKHGTGTRYFDYLKESRINDGIGEDFPASPFYDYAEWSLAKWLTTSGLSMECIDEFLKLPYVSS
jgi:hypothetical protein